jgi:multiple sugar transport system substrate-binding protein
MAVDNWGAQNAKIWLGKVKTLLVVVLLAGFAYPILTAKMKATPYEGRQKIKFWHRWGGEWEKVVFDIAKEFNESQTEYEVVPMFVTGTGSETKFILSATGGDPCDVMSIWNGGLAPLAAADLLTPLESLMTPEELKYFQTVPYPSVRESGQFKGKTYGITIGADLFGYYVNADHLREAGLDPDQPPKTFSELVAMGKKLEKRDPKGNLLRMGLNVASLQTHCYAYGPGFWDDKKKELRLNTPDMVEALTAMVEQRKSVGFQNAQRFWASQNTGSSTGAWPFIDGAVSITYDGQWRVEEIRKYKPNMDYRVWPIPPPEGGRPLPGSIGGNYMIIPVAAKNKKGAFEWLKFWSGLTQPNRAAKFENWGGWLPLSPDVAHSPTYEGYVKQNPRFQTFIDILDGPNCHAYPPVGYLAYLLDELQRAEDTALRGSKTPKQALDELDANIKKELKKRKEMGFDDSL